MWLRLALPTWVLVPWSRLLPFPKPQVAFLPYPATNPPHMWYLPQVAFPKPRVAFPQDIANAPPYMWYLPQVAFPKPRVALAQQAHMQYSPHVAFL